MRYAIVLGLLGVVTISTAGAQRPAPGCVATTASLTPAEWKLPQRRFVEPRDGLRMVKEIPLPGPANRFDYQSVDSASGRLYINHMNAGTTLVFDVVKGVVISEIRNVPRATGVLAVPSHHSIFISAAGAHEVVGIDDRTLRVSSRAGGIGFPDGIAFAPVADKLFVSDESGAAEVVLDAATGRNKSTIPLGGEAGNTHYDSVSHCILVAVQTANQLVAIDPVTEKIVRRYDLPGSDHPHGFAIDGPGRLAFISCEGNSVLLVVDLRNMQVIQTIEVADGPDVIAWDGALGRLYVASEAGEVAAFRLDGRMLRLFGSMKYAHAHTVSVDPRTHLIYVPLQDVRGWPVLRILSSN
jgi:DNA-binding beta-propeller fold protein YncE